MASHQTDFLQNLDFQISSHLSDSSLSVNRLLRLMGMSRTDLHRKTKLLAGMSTTAYVRHHRLNKAAELLRIHQDWCIDSIAIEAGFHNLGHFYRMFKEKFGCSPGEWRIRVLKFGTLA